LNNQEIMMMQRSFRLAFAAGSLGLVVAAITACSSDEGQHGSSFTPPAMNASGAGGSTGGNGPANTAGAAGSGGTMSQGGSIGSAGSSAAGTPGVGGSAGATGTAGGGMGQGGDAMGTGWMGYPGVEDLSTKKATTGCGSPAGIALGEWVEYDVDVAVPANHDGFGGDGKRTYYVKLPKDYDPATVYKVVIGGSSCVDDFDPNSIDFDKVTGATGGAIQITPIVEADVMKDGSSTCYDDKDTNSIEYPLMEAMLQQVGAKFCYDQHKVFVQGHSSGGWYSNMTGCVYGSTLLRAMSSNGGGLAQGDGERPPCSADKPEAGMWILPVSDDEGVDETHIAVDRALKLNKCEGGEVDGAWQSAPSDSYSKDGAVNCKKYKCPDAFPVIFCTPPGGHALQPWHPAAAWGFFNALP
jgi:polyhydroxybutyrate depolymerase